MQIRTEAFRRGRGAIHINPVRSSEPGKADIFFFQVMGDRQHYIGEPGRGCEEKIMHHDEGHPLQGAASLVEVEKLVQQIASDDVKDLDVTWKAPGVPFHEGIVDPADVYSGKALRRHRERCPQPAQGEAVRAAGRMAAGDPDIPRQHGQGHGRPVELLPEGRSSRRPTGIKGRRLPGGVLHGKTLDHPGVDAGACGRPLGRFGREVRASQNMGFECLESMGVALDEHIVV